MIMLFKMIIILLFLDFFLQWRWVVYVCIKQMGGEQGVWIQRRVVLTWRPNESNQKKEVIFLLFRCRVGYQINEQLYEE